MYNRWKIHVFICCVASVFDVTVLAATVAPNGSCNTPNRERGTCIDLYDCPTLVSLVTATISTQDRNFLAQSQCNYVNNNVYVCCPTRSIGNVSPQPNSIGTNMAQTDLLPKPPQCGKQLTDRIVGGNITYIDEFPWMALIEYTKPGNVKGHHCGGTLITNRYVVTAGHCVTGKAIPSNWILSGVRLGEWDTTTNPDCDFGDCAPKHIDVPVVERIPHPRYLKEGYQLHDIALLRLGRAVAITDFVKPICLSNPYPEIRNNFFSGVALDVAGWGSTETEAASTKKLKAIVNAVNLESCRQTYAGKNIRLEESQMCAGGQLGVDSCRGDSGGPLMVKYPIERSSYYFLAGVVSFGPTPCGLQGWPGVYTRVGAYVDWINDSVKP